MEKHETIDVAWPLILARSLPSLLSKLLEKGALVSLERLQLVSCVITKDPLGDGQCDTLFRNISLKRHRQGLNPMIMLSGSLSIAPHLCVQVVLSYFERGARKYFRPTLPGEDGYKSEPFESITYAKAAHFLQSIDQDPTLLLDERVAELNGFAAVFVPAELLMIELIAKLDLTPIESWVFTFFTTVALDEQLSLLIAPDGQKIVLKAGAKSAVYLEAFANKLSADPALNHSICTGERV